MKTQIEVLEAIKQGRKSECLDGRDYMRLSDFYSVEHLEVFGIKLKEGSEPPPVTEWTKENIIDQLREDVAFGFEKALNQRSISSSLMYRCVRMWLWILDDDLQHLSGYSQYGLPLFKAVALKYDFPNPIKEDSGSESKYQG